MTINPDNPCTGYTQCDTCVRHTECGWCASYNGQVCARTFGSLNWDTCDEGFAWGLNECSAIADPAAPPEPPRAPRYVYASQDVEGLIAVSFLAPDHEARRYLRVWGRPIPGSVPHEPLGDDSVLFPDDRYGNPPPYDAASTCRFTAWLPFEARGGATLIETRFEAPNTREYWFWVEVAWDTTGQYPSAFGESPGRGSACDPAAVGYGTDGCSTAEPQATTAASALCWN